MRLFFSAASPYVRKVRIVAIETGLDDTIELVPVDVWDESTDLRAHNPLAKVPALAIDGGPTLFDSAVICEYLDAQGTGAKVIPADGPARWAALRRQALADGVLDACVLARLEAVFRTPEQRSQRWVDRQALAITSALDRLEAEADELGEPPTIGEIAAACALGYRDFRFAGVDWRTTRPRLAAWYEAFRKRPSMRQTEPQG